LRLRQQLLDLVASCRHRSVLDIEEHRA